jgi:soluble lytic murein transglycosylase
MKVRLPVFGSLLTAGAMMLGVGAASGQTPPTEIPQGSYVAGSPTPPLQAFAQDDPRSVLSVLEAAKRGDGASIQAAMAVMTDPLWRDIALWALADGAPESMSWQEADAARGHLADWPRSIRRQIAAEKLLDRSNMTPREMIAWFGADDPATPQGAMALASALRAAGQPGPAALVVRRAWRGMAFDQSTQEAMLARFFDVLTLADHIAREDFLLYGVQGPAAQDMLRLIPADQQALAEARMAVRRDDPQASSLIAALPVADQTSPGLAYERVLALRDRGDVEGALALVGYLPEALPNEAAEKLWRRGTMVVDALRAGNNLGAYAAAAHSGLVSGPDAAEAQFYAGWIALSRLKDARAADDHFASLQRVGQSPLTQSRALYWRGRAAEAQNDPLAAQLYFGQAARFQTTFYGQLAATRGGPATLVLGQDPRITSADRDRFEARGPVRAARLIAGLGAKDTFRAFVVGLSETLPSAADEAMLVDFTRSLGEQELSMRVVRNAAKRDFILPERGYPVRSLSLTPGAAEAPLVLGITRQESSFEPLARSGAGARGMMQLMSATAQGVARRAGLGWGSLDDPDYNMKVGSTYLGGLVEEFSGSYVLATAAYNAGPGRPVQWIGLCGDPRSSATDPLDFIECIPFSETRDYVMRVLEATQVYRARLNGGVAPITLATDLKRGRYGYQPATPAADVQPVRSPAAP